MTNKILKRLIVGLFSICFSTGVINAQDAAFSQYYSSQLYLNPAYAGSESSATVGLNARTQWKSVTQPYQTNQVSLILPFYRKVDKQNNFGGVGLSVYNDNAGSGKLTAVGANLNISYVLRLSEKHHVLFGIQGGIIQKKIDFSTLQWGSQYDAFNGFNSSIDPGEYNSITASKLYPDIGAGFLYFFKPGRDIREKGAGFYFGASSYHLNRPNESMVIGQASPLPVLNKIHAGFDYSLNSRVNLSPNVLVAQQSNVLQINAGMYLNYALGLGTGGSLYIPSELIIGAWYRVGDAYIASIGFGSDIYTIGFSYDVNNSSLRRNTQGRGAYEISLKLTKPRKVKTRRYFTPRI
ncbi:MAG TPA: type IX secretion system membrane protein PorP/SprF [Cytophagaceae bacterium]|nr:type IX secretion system membrane protein PorP/SprF [Cytophagaceae bacterium]